MSKRVAIVVTAFLGLMSCCLLVPFVNNVRAQALREGCKNNLRTVAGLLFLVDPESLPAGTVVVPALPPERRVSWYATLLRPLGWDDLATALDRSAGWEAAANASARTTTFDRFLCPAARMARESSAGTTDYVGSAGVGADAATLPADNPRAGAFRYDAPTPLAAFKDGTSNCLLLLETSDRPGLWIAGGPPTLRPFDPAHRPYLGSGRPFGGNHVGGCCVAFADGSFRFLADSASPDVLEMLAAIADGP